MYSHELYSKKYRTYRNWSRAEKVNHGRKMKQKKTDKQRERKKRKTRGKRPFLYRYLCVYLCIYILCSLSLYNKKKIKNIYKKK